jgi:hypothetical protein
MAGNRQRTETMDGLAWASLSETATIARVASLMVRKHNKHDYPTKKEFQKAISDTVPPRGRCGPMLEPLETEYKRQRAIYWDRQEKKKAWDEYLATIAKRETRINLAYAGAYGRPVHWGVRHNPYAWEDREKRHKWDLEEKERHKGDDCRLLVIGDGCIVAVLWSVTPDKADSDEVNKPQIKVKYLPSGRVFTTLIRDRPDDFGELFSSLGGYAVTGALAHSKHVEIDWKGRRFTVHEKDGSTHDVPWQARKYVGTEDTWRQKEVDIEVMGRKTLGEVELEGEPEDDED